MPESLKDSAMRYHTHPTPGKLCIQPTKPRQILLPKAYFFRSV